MSTSSPGHRVGRRPFLHLVPEGLEQACGVFNGRHALGVDFGLDRRGDHRVSDPQPARLGTDLLGIRALRGGRDVGVAGSRAVHRLEDRRGVADGSRDDQLLGEAGKAVAEDWPLRVRARVGFSPTSPFALAGIRIDPPPSFAWAAGTIPAAVAAPEPPLEPPVEREVSQGLRLAP